MTMKKKGFIKKYILALLVVFTLAFMGLIFGPTEIFMGNYRELEFIYQEFGGTFIGAAVAISIVVSALISILPEKIYKLVLTFISSVVLAAYVQSMFLNRGLEQLGVTAEGYNPDKRVSVINAIIWFGIMIAMGGVIHFKNKCCKKILSTVCGFLLLIQLVAFSTLFLTAEASAFEYTEEGIGLDMSEQLTVSSRENILVLCLDTVPNEWWEETGRMYPDMQVALKDFTYYNNADSCYWGTFPSVLHVLTGNEFDVEKGMADYFVESWDNEKTNSYFELLKKNDYKVNLFITQEEDIIGQNSLEILSGKVSNITDSLTYGRVVNYGLLYETLVKMSCYRYAPNVIKPLFNVTNEQYESIVTLPERDMAYANCDYYAKLLSEGIKVTDESNYFSFTLLNGAHEFVNDENCKRVKDPSDRNKTIKGITVMLSEYILQLQEAGVYDNSTIIIMSDHGTMYNAQPIFFIKKPNEQHDELQVTNAPISYREIVPTIVQLLGEDYTEYGQSIYEFTENQWRERVLLERAYDGNYPMVMCYDGIGNANANVWYKYTYWGDRWYLLSDYELLKYEVIPMVDGYY